jgi:hypothetical protein
MGGRAPDGLIVFTGQRPVHLRERSNRPLRSHAVVDHRAFESGSEGASLGCDLAETLRAVLPNPEPSVPSSQDCLGSVCDLELGEDRGEMVGDGLR